jgi:hypothetical protein
VVIGIEPCSKGTSLPWLLRWLGLRAEDFRTEENEARLQAARAALAWLDDHSGAEGADDATESLRALYEARVRRLQIIPRAIRDRVTSRRWSGI